MEAMEDEEKLSSRESLKLIASMINNARKDYFDTGVSALLWGGVITFCSLVSFCSYFLKMDWLTHVWFLTILAVVPQVIISIRESKVRSHKSYDDDLMGGIWISFAISMFLLSYFVNVYHVPHEASFYMIIYGIPTFATGYARRFRPMLIGGVACWVFAILSTYCPYPYTMIYTAVAAQLAWFIPGLILRRRYKNAKQQHV